MVWFPELIMTQLDDAVVQLDTDRSKFIRQAVRLHLQRVAGGGRKALEGSAK